LIKLAGCGRKNCNLAPARRFTVKGLSRTGLALFRLLLLYPTNDAALDAIPTKRLIGNQLFTLCAMMAPNLSRELQMLASPVAERALPKRLDAFSGCVAKSCVIKKKLKM
jgi:hypothetical protein